MFRFQKAAGIFLQGILRPSKIEFSKTELSKNCTKCWNLRSQNNLRDRRGLPPKPFSGTL